MKINLVNNNKYWKLKITSKFPTHGDYNQPFSGQYDLPFLAPGRCVCVCVLAGGPYIDGWWEREKHGRVVKRVPGICIYISMTSSHRCCWTYYRSEDHGHSEFYFSFSTTRAVCYLSNIMMYLCSTFLLRRLLLLVKVFVRVKCNNLNKFQYICISSCF